MEGGRRCLAASAREETGAEGITLTVAEKMVSLYNRRNSTVEYPVRRSAYDDADRGQWGCTDAKLTRRQTDAARTGKPESKVADTPLRLRTGASDGRR